ncbi:NifX-associated protein [Candidatus Hydrogenisulfobacillus filiaventi]|uniref:NifX-associated protein n=1 Tax=Candidatus Hydrogenisulfobacillus filiaventi TaxID=2707344 RepID=A0A6F8ZED2_9FIRM|nr:DUF269 domain-containing protein [Bacillota bacterium]CAB1127959.1 NifX-associated protein [Candidatus Hydrogenisulfobacillus filiaventi]
MEPVDAGLDSRSLPAVSDELVRQLRATYALASSRPLSEEALLRPFLPEPEVRRRRTDADLDDRLKGYIRVFYQAVAAVVEREIGALVTVALDLNEESFGRVLLYAGRLLLYEGSLRDAYRFGFRDRNHLDDTGRRIVRQCLEAAAAFPDALRA